MGMPTRPPNWTTEGIASADLVRGYRAARELQRTPLPPQLGKALANYILRTEAELIVREIDPLKLTAEGSEQ